MNATEPRRTRHPLMRPWHAVVSWLARVPVSDPVDRRNAPMVQIVVLLLAVAPPAMWLYRIVASSQTWRTGETASLIMSMALSAIAAASFVMIRRGLFQLAAKQLLGVVALLMLLSSIQGGYTAQSHEQPMQVVWLVLAGLVIGRKALWLMFAVTVLAVCIGVSVDIIGAKVPRFSSSDQIVNGLMVTVLFLFIAVVIDRSVAALRESLREATARGDALARSNTQLEEAMRERERVTDQLVHARKVEAVGHLAGGVAHDFNHLLALVLGYVRRAQAATTAAEIRAALDGIESAARRAVAASATLLDFSRTQERHLEVFDAGAAIRECEPMLQQVFGPEVRLVLDLSPKPNLILFDRARFTLIALNLATNAKQAMPQGGEFRIRVHATVDTVSIEFIDNGTGIPATLQARIFEPFFTTKPSGQGTGLGLSVAADLIADAGGQIDVRSAPGEGAVFVVALPRAA